MDDLSSLKVWDLKNCSIIAEENQVSKGLLSATAIDPVDGKMVACGGIDGKVYVFQLNLDQSKNANDKTIKLI